MSEPEFSLARHTLLVLGAATAVLVLTVVVLAVARPGPGWALMVVAGGLLGCIAAMAGAARWSTRAVGSSEPD